MATRTWTVGQLARRTGVSVRALHHYDEIGLLSPTGRTAAGYRLYGDEEVARLQRITTLRQMGFSLTETRDVLDQPSIAPGELLAQHILGLQAHIAREQHLCDRLRELAGRMSSQRVIATEEFLDLIEEMTMVDNSEKYYTPEQRAWLRARAETMGDERIRQVEAAWPQLIAQVRAEMERGTDPSEERVQRLAGRWRELVQTFTGGNPAIEASLQSMYTHEPDLRHRTGVEHDVMHYITKALAVDR